MPYGCKVFHRPEDLLLGEELLQSTGDSLPRKWPELLPEAVTTDGQGYYRMAYAEVTPVLVEAIKEQQQTIERLKQENNKLKARYADTEARLEVLETTVKRVMDHHRRQPRRK